MKNFKFLGLLLTLFSFSLFLTSCEDDGTGGGTGGGDDEFPTVAFNGSSSYTENPGDTVTITVTATASVSANGGELATIEVFENGARIADIQRVLWNGAVQSGAITLSGSERQMFVYDVGIIVSDFIDSTNIYKILVADSDNRVVESADISITTEGLPPSLTTSMMSGTTITGPNTLIGYPLSAEIGSGQLSTITVNGPDGSPISDSRIFWDGPLVMDNPFPLSEDYLDGFSDIKLEVRSLGEPTTETISVILTDVNGLTSTQSFTIITKTAIEANMGVLFNQSGPTGTGGLDLDEGIGTPSESSLAEIRDMGNDPVSGDWLMQINTINDSQIKKLVPGQNNLLDDFTFEAVEYKEDLESFFNNGADYNNEQVSKDDMFAVTRDGKFYVIRIAEINDVSADNSDNYEVDIKK